VVPAVVPDPQPTGPILNPQLLDPPPIAPITTTVAPIPPLVAPAGTPVRDLTLNETFDAYGRLIQTLGTTTPTGAGFGLAYEAPTTERVAAESTEVWRIFNTTGDTHPIHFHLVNVFKCSRVSPSSWQAAAPSSRRPEWQSVHNRTNWVGRKPCKCTQARSPRSL
jgi:spore coat protein A